MKSTEIRPGVALKFDNFLYVCTAAEHRTPGNLRAFIQATLKRVPDGTIIEKRLRSGDEVEEVSLDRRDMEYLYTDATGHVFMDTETFDQTPINAALLGDTIHYLKPNTRVTVLVAEEKPVMVEAPKTVDLKVTETQPGIKGATATNQLKEATLETGFKTRVPPFIETGEIIRISTSDGSYLSRA